MYNSETKIITAPVSVRDVQLALGSSSGDVRTLCTLSNINPWAKYKPTPAYAGQDTPAAITDAQRALWNWGVRASFDDIMTGFLAEYRNYLNGSGDKPDIRLQEFALGKFARLTDFVKYPVESGKGYWHNAHPFIPTYKEGNVEHRLKPILPETERNIAVRGSIPCIFPLPDDSTYMRLWANGATSEEESADSRNRLCLGLLDVWAYMLKGAVSDAYKYSRHGIAMFKKYGQQWEMVSYVVYDATDDGVWNKPFIDFNDGRESTAEQPQGITDPYKEIKSWKDMRGNFKVVEFLTSIAYGANLPLFGYEYDINVTSKSVGEGELNIYDIDGNPVIVWRWGESEVYPDAAVIIAVPKEYIDGTPYGISYNALTSGYYSSLGARVVNANNSGIVYGTGTIDNPTSTNDLEFFVTGMTIPEGVTRVKIQIYGTKESGSSLGDGIFESDAIAVIR